MQETMTEKRVGEVTETSSSTNTNKVWRRTQKRTSSTPNQRSKPLKRPIYGRSSKTNINNTTGTTSTHVPSASLEVIPDEALANILGRVTDARILARCSGVCRRWRRVSRQVPVIKLILRKMQAWQAEGVISAALLERKNLREFEVRFVCPRKYANEGVRESRVFGCLWRLSSSIESLTLICPNTVYFKLWTWLAKFPKLSCLRIHCGRIEENPIPGSFDHLKKCEFSRTIISEPMLEDTVRYAGMLEELVVVGCDPIESLSLQSESLKHINLVATEEWPMRRLDLEIPNLQELYVCYVEQLQMEGDKVIHLGLYSACLPQVSSLHNLVSLEIDGKGWALESIEHIVCAAQAVQHLVIKASISEIKPLRIEHYLSPMFFLQALILESNLLECFWQGFQRIPFDGEKPVFALKKVAVKISNETKECTSLLKSLVGYCPNLQLLILDTTEVDTTDFEIPSELKELEDLNTRVRVVFYNNPKDQVLVKEIADILNRSKS